VQFLPLFSYEPLSAAVQGGEVVDKGFRGGMPYYRFQWVKAYRCLKLGRSSGGPLNDFEADCSAARQDSNTAVWVQV